MPLTDQQLQLSLAAIERSTPERVTAYHASSMHVQQALENGLAPRAHHDEHLWANPGEHSTQADVFVVPEHVYFFQHKRDAAVYFDNHNLGLLDEQRRSRRTVYRAELEVANMDIDPEQLERILAQDEPEMALSPQVRFTMGEGSDAHEITMASRAILAELKERHARLVAQIDQDFQDDPAAREFGRHWHERVKLAWQVYDELPETSKRIVVASALYGEPINAMALTHRGPVAMVDMDRQGTDWARMTEQQRRERGGKFEKHVQRQMAEQRFRTFKDSERYLSLATDDERAAFRELCWMTDEGAMDRRVTLRAEQIAKGREFRERHAPAPVRPTLGSVEQARPAAPGPGQTVERAPGR